MEFFKSLVNAFNSPIDKVKVKILERRIKRILSKLNELEKDNKFLLDENQVLKTKIREYKNKEIKKRMKGKNKNG